MKDYDISEKYKRIYQGILKWKQAGYKGLFQYTERIDIPLVISEVIQHVANQFLILKRKILFVNALFIQV